MTTLKQNACVNGHTRTEKNTYTNPKTGRRSCRSCGAISKAKWRQSPQGRDYMETYAARYRAEHRDKAKQYSKNRYQRVKETETVKARSRMLLNNWGITDEQYEQMLEKQGGVCALCGLPPRQVRLAVDHDHSTGKIRGLIHANPCNLGIGMFNDSPAKLINALVYLDSGEVS